VERPALNLGSRQAFRRVLDTVPVSCWILADGHILYANPCFVQLIGALSADEVEGRDAVEFFAAGSQGSVGERIRQVVARRRSPRSEETLITVEGIRVDVEVSSELVDYAGASAMLCAFHDISERKRMERAFREGALRFGTLVEGDLIGVAEWHAERFVAANDVFLKMIGRSREELERGRLRWADITPPEYSQLDRDKVAELLSTGECKPFEKEYVRPDGSRVSVLTCGALVAPAPKWRAIGFIIDVTDRRRLQEMRAEKLRLESITLLAAGMAHNLNNLLTGVIGNASLLLEKRDGAPSAKTRRILEEIVASGERAASLTAQLLAYAGKGRFVLAPTDLGELVKAEVARIRSGIPERMRMEVKVAADLPPLVVDSDQLQHAVEALVMNAVEAIGDREDGAIVMEARVERVAEKALSSPSGEIIDAGRYCVLEVTDNGCGMDDKTLEHVFDPFFSTKFMGRGLGLAAVAGIVRWLRGAIQVDSTPGVGTAFRIYLPAPAER
jgi:PAS domain S-box-containing protein